MKRPAVIVGLVLAVGIAGTAIALRSREGDTQFVAKQQDLLPVSAASLQRLLLTTSDPRPGFGGRARDARCRSARARALGNPWSCEVRYRRLPRMSYRVTVYADRSIQGVGRAQGDSQEAASTVRGCCVGAP